MAFIFIFMVPSAAAVNKDNATVVAMAETILSGPMHVIVEAVKPAASPIAGDTTGGVFNNMWTICTGTLPDYFKTPYAFLKTLGFLLALAITLAHIFDHIQKEQNPVEAVWKSLIELFMTCLIILNIDKILDQFGAATSAIIDQFEQGADLTPTATVDDLLIALTGHSTGNMFWQIKAWMALSIPWVLAQLIIIGAKFVVIQICLEIIIRKLFVPIAIADIYHEGLRSPGMRYIKRYAGAYLKMVVCVVITIAISRIAGGVGSGHTVSSAGDGFDLCFSIIAINFSSIAIMLKAGEYTNDIIGA